MIGLKKLLPVLGLLVLVAWLMACGAEPTPTATPIPTATPTPRPTPTPTPVPIIRAEDLWRDFSENQVYGEREHLGRTYRVAGRINDLGRDRGTSRLYLRFSTGAVSDSVLCYIPESQAQDFAFLRKGDEGVVRGMVKTYTSSQITLDPCSLITDKLPTATPTATLIATTESQKASLVIANDPSELNFTTQDFPMGWQIADKGEQDGGFHVRAMKLIDIIAYPEVLVTSWIRVFPNVDSASQSYASERLTKAEKFVLDNPRVGAESFRYSGNATYEVYFRIANVLARVTMYSMYGGSLEAVTQWAEKLEAKIDRVKRVGTGRATTTLPTATATTTKVGESIGTPTPTPVPTPTPTPTPPPASGKIASTSLRDGNGEIYVMNADGTGQTRLTNNYATDTSPAWSP